MNSDNFLQLTKEHNKLINELNKKSNNLKINLFNKIDSSKVEELINTKSLDILSDKFKNSLLLNYELNIMTPKKTNVTSIEEYTKLAFDYIDKYKLCYGSEKLEDIDWNIHTSSSNKYELEKNEVVFDNTLCPIYKYDLSTFNFIKRLTEYLGLIDSHVKCEFKYIYDKNFDTIEIVILCRYKKIDLLS
jgi:hypothetical protein